MRLPRFVWLPLCMSVGLHLRGSICEASDPKKLMPKLWTLSLSCGVWVRLWSQIWVPYDTLIYLFKINLNMDLRDFCCFQYRQWNRLTNRTKPAFTRNSLDEIGLHAELSYFRCIIQCKQIGLHLELIYIGCIIQCKWNWLTRKIYLYWLYYTV